MIARFRPIIRGNSVHARACLSGLAASVFSLFGCQHSEYANRRVEHRLAGVEQTVKAWEKSEASRPGKLDREFALIGKELEVRQQKFDRSIQGAGEILAHDVKRFEARQEDYRREIWRILWGKPERIEKTAIDMFY